MKILVDVSAGMGIATAIRSLGYDTEDVRDRDATMPDVDILAWAIAEHRFIVTMDKDFGELVYHSGMAHAGVLLLRLEAARTAQKIAVVTDILNAHGSKLAGRFCVYQNGRLRIR